MSALAAVNDNLCPKEIDTAACLIIGDEVLGGKAGLTSRRGVTLG
jgi:hypothetical protein